MKARLSRRNFSGFTLIELVISASLMALILGSAYLCLSSGISSQKLIESRGDVIQGAECSVVKKPLREGSSCANGDDSASSLLEELATLHCFSCSSITEELQLLFPSLMP